MPPRTKVFLVLECGSPHGVGRQVAAIVDHLDPAVFETWVVYAVRSGTSPEEYERMTASASRRVHVPSLVRRVAPLKDLAALWTLYRLMRRERPDVVHAQSSKAGVLARLAAWLARVPRVYYSPHGYGFQQTDAGPVGRRLYWWFEKAVSGIGHIVASSAGEERHARGLSWGKEVFHVRNLSPEEPMPPRSRPADDASVLVGAVGRLSRARRPEAFARLAAALARERPNARFVWIGGGELLDEMRREAARLGLADQLEITGHLPRPELLQRLADLDVFVHYSQWEGGSPTAVLEAMRCAKPVVASDIPGNDDTVEPGVTGFLARDEDDLRRRVSELVASASLRAELGRNGKARLEREFSLAKSAAAFASLYTRPPAVPSHSP